jgi:hypothetical protein
VNSDVFGRFRSPRLRRIEPGVLDAIIIAYLSMITYSLSDRLESTRHMVLIVVLWCLGNAALVLLVGSCRLART